MEGRSTDAEGRKQRRITVIMGEFPNIPGLKDVDPATLARLCVKHRIASIRVYGSAARGELTSESDVDLLVEFLAGTDPDLYELGGLQQDLTDLLGREVDLKTPSMFSEANLRRVLAGAVMAYAA